MKHIFFLLFVLVHPLLPAQSIENVSFFQEGNDIIVYYDYVADDSQSCDVSLLYSLNNGMTFTPCHFVSGDTGRVTPYFSRRIEWKASKELGSLSTSNMRMRVQAKVEEENDDTEATIQKEEIKRLRDLIWSPEMTLVKGGTFWMGTPETQEGRNADETLHEVWLSDYYISSYEVSVEDFSRFVQNTNYQTDAEKNGGSYGWIFSTESQEYEWTQKSTINWTKTPGGADWTQAQLNHPVVHVSWNDALKYCAWLSKKTGYEYTLPTEAQWEYPARSRGLEMVYTWGDTFPMPQKVGNVLEQVYPSEAERDGFFSTAPCGSFPPNQIGLYDMSGNVWEWCLDTYSNDYYQLCQYKGLIKDPQGLEFGHLRIQRGGSWSSTIGYCRVTHRHSSYAEGTSGDIGFRIVRLVEPDE